MRLLVAVGLLAGCDVVFGIAPVKDASSGGSATDAALDATIDSAPGCLGTGLVTNRCPPAGVHDIAIQGPFDTTSCSSALVSGMVDGDLCVVFGINVTVGGTMVTGSHVLVVVATQSLFVLGPLDAGAHDTSGGPNARSCGTAVGMSGSLGVGNSGGGGAGACGSGRGGSGGIAGSPGAGSGCAQPFTLALRGGCDGGNGGSAVDMNNGGAGARGGGAVYLIAGTQIDVRGGIYAGGGGGKGGGADGGGGGGGGAGGLIGFDAPLLTVTPSPAVPFVCARGGGGGGGGSSTGSMIGGAGNEACMTAGAAVMGGIPGGVGGTGGTGGGAARDGGSSTGGSSGGGGGGGAAGFVVVFGGAQPAILQTAVTIPPAS